MGIQYSQHKISGELVGISLPTPPSKRNRAEILRQIHGNTVNLKTSLHVYKCTMATIKFEPKILYVLPKPLSHQADPIGFGDISILSTVINIRRCKTQNF